MHTQPYPQDLCGPPGTPGCQHPGSQIAYAPLPRNDPVFSQPLPIITFSSAGRIVEVRDYNQVIPLAAPVTDAIIVQDDPSFSGTFGNPPQQLCGPQVVCHRIGIVIYQDQPAGGPMVPFVAIYYYDISPLVTMTSNVGSSPPETTIDSGPPANTRRANATFTFSADEEATFDCKVDGGGFEPCTSPETVTVGVGPHTFQVRATDTAGNVDSSPASWSWTRQG